MYIHIFVYTHICMGFTTTHQGSFWEKNAPFSGAHLDAIVMIIKGGTAMERPRWGKYEIAGVQMILAFSSKFNYYSSCNFLFIYLYSVKFRLLPIQGGLCVCERLVRLNVGPKYPNSKKGRINPYPLFMVCSDEKRWQMINWRGSSVGPWENPNCKNRIQSCMRPFQNSFFQSQLDRPLDWSLM